MSIRTIMIFPEFENMEIIDNIREKYDPLAQLVRPHITLVFPFENEMSNEMIEEILIKRLQDVKPFEIVLNGISMKEDRFGNYLFSELNKFKFAREVIIYDLYKGNGQIMLSNLRYYSDDCGCSYYI